ncbi:MAG: sporulation transcription factor Spo0A [Bacilli bacterium]|nr:sporulation transcription factor Spo0A [Bacilli bacterium]
MMKNTYRLLVIDNDQFTTNQLKNYFSSHAVMNVVKVIEDGEEGLNYIINNRDSFDCLILDLLLPNIDGLYILDVLKQKRIDKKILVLSGYKDNKVIENMSKYNIDYYMMKPFSLESLEIRLKDVLLGKKAHDYNIEMDRKISKILHSLGVPSHIKGYSYIRESIKLMYNLNDVNGGITKEIYPEIAKKFDSTTSRVERAIRHAIEISWNRGDYEVMEEIFGHSVDFDRAKPTNSEFIATIADHLRLSIVQF